MKDKFCRCRWGGLIACVCAVNAAAQSLPEAFEPPGALAEPPQTSWLLLTPQVPRVAQQWSAGVHTLDLGRGTHSSSTPLGWSRRAQAEDGSAWSLQLQTDGYKRVTSPTGQRSGLADVTLTSGWEVPLLERLVGTAAVGALLPTHGEVGGKKAAALLSAGAVGGPAGSKTKFAGSLTLLHNVPPAAPGSSRNALRADAAWAQVWTERFRTRLSVAHMRQEAAPQFSELALLATVIAQPGFEWRGRIWTQDIEQAQRRVGAGVAAALAF